jgi:succinate dehydrogenase (ubiquinone) flavoprotein subunit
MENLTPGKPHKAISEETGLESVKFLDQIRNANGPKATADIRLGMQKVMQSNAALFRYVLPSSCDKKRN